MKTNFEVAVALTRIARQLVAKSDEEGFEYAVVSDSNGAVKKLIGRVWSLPDESSPASPEARGRADWGLDGLSSRLVKDWVLDLRGAVGRLAVNFKTGLLEHSEDDGRVTLTWSLVPASAEDSDEIREYLDYHEYKENPKLLREIRL